LPELRYSSRLLARSVRLRRFIFTAVVAAGLAGCSHAKPETVEADLGGGVTETVQGDETRKAFDLNGDAKPDAFDYYKRGKDEAGKPTDKLVRKEFDLNGDGKIDFWRWYDEKEAVEKESSDLDFDGKIDVTTHYAKQVRVKEERDFDAQGKPHTWVYYEKNAVARKEKDTHQTGKPDYWEYWENGVVDRIAFDRNGDGQVDFWEKNPQTQNK